MFFRLKFDSAVSEILTRIGISGSNEQLAFWPTGYTKQFVGIAKSRGISPQEAAAWAVCDLITKKIKEGEMPRAGGLASCALARDWLAMKGTSQEFLDHLNEYVNGSSVPD